MANNKRLEVTLAFSADTRSAQAQLKNLQNDLSKLSHTPIDINAKNFDQLKAASVAAEELQVHLKNAINQDTGKLDFTKLNKSLEKSGTSVEEYGKALLQAGDQGKRAFDELADAIAYSEIPLKRSNKLLSETWKELKNAAKWQISSRVVDSFAAGIRNAYDYAQDLNESLNNIRIVTGQNIDQMTKFAEKANKAARTLSTTTTEYTDAALIYYQQGLSDAEVEQRTNATVKMANVTGESAQAVSDQMTAIWNNFYDGSKSLEYYADVITELGAATASSTDEISAGLEKFASVADTVGLSYEYATSALATVTSETRQSADVVGTAFKTLFARIQDLELGETLEDGTTMGKYSEALNAVGINIKDSNGALKDMDDILDEMGSKWGTLNKDQQVALAQTVAGVRQYTQLVSLMDNWGTFQENLNIARTSEGALQEQQDIYAESWEAAADKVKAALETIYSSLINDEFFIDMLQAIEWILVRVDALIDGFGGLKGVLASVSSIMTQIFSKQMTESIRSTGEILKRAVNRGKTDKAKKTQTSASLATVAQEESGSDPHTQQARGDQDNYLKKIKKAISDKTGVIDEQQMQFAETYYSQIKQITDQYVRMAEAADRADNEAKELGETLKNSSNIQGKEYGTNQSDFVALVKEYEKLKMATESGKTGAIQKSKQALQQKVQKIETNKKIIIPIDFDEDDLNTIKQKIDQFFMSGQQITFDFDVTKLQEGDNKIQALQQKVEELRSQGVKIDLMTDEELQDAEKYQQYVDEIKQSVSAFNSFPAPDAVLDYVDATHEAEQGLLNLSAAQEKVAQSTTEVETAIKGMNVASADWADKTMAVAQAATSLVSIYTSVNGLTEMWGDETVSTGDKVTSTITQVGVTGISAVTGIATALKVLTSLTAGPIAIISAIITGLGIALPFIVKALDNAWETDKEKAARLREEVDSLNNSITDTKERIESLDNTKDTYDSLLEKIKGLREGTDEWKQAIEEAQQALLILKEDLPEGIVTYNSQTGLFEIDEQKYEAYKQKTEATNEARTYVADYKNIATNQNEADSEIADKTQNFIEKKDKSGSLENPYADILKDNFEEILFAENPEEAYKKLLDEAGLNYTDSTGAYIKNDPDSTTSSSLANPIFDSFSSEKGKKEWGQLKKDYEEYYSIIEKNDQLLNELGAASHLNESWIIKTDLSKNAEKYIKQYEEEYDFASLETEELEKLLGVTSTQHFDTDSDGSVVVYNKDGSEAASYTPQNVQDFWVADKIAADVDNKKNDIANLENKYANDSLMSALLRGESLDNVLLRELAPEEIRDLSSTGAGAEIGSYLAQNKTYLNDLASELGITDTKNFTIQALESLAKNHINISPVLSNMDSKQQESLLSELSQFDSYEDLQKLPELFTEFGITSEDAKNKLIDWTREQIKAAKDSKTYEQRLEEINAELEKYGINEEKLEQMKDYLKEVNPELADHEELLAEAARKQMLMSNGMSDLKENAETYENVLKTINEKGLSGFDNLEALEQLNAFRTALAQVLDIDESELSIEFLKENFTDLKKILEGDTVALSNLRKELVEKYLLGIGVDSTELNTWLAQYENLDLADIEVGTTLDATPYLNSLYNMLKATGASVDEINEAFGAIGFTLKPIYGEVSLFESNADFNKWATMTGLDQNSAAAEFYKVRMITSYEVVGNNNQVANNLPSSTKSGGGSSPSKKETKDNIKADDHIDRYKEINDVLDDINDTYEKLNSQTDRYFGANRIQALKNESEALKLVNQGLRKKYDLTEQYLNSDKKALEAAGFTVDDTFGNITNYEERMKELIAGVNSAIDDYNTAVNNYNGKITEDTRSEDMENDENIIESKQEAIDAAQEKLDNAKELISKYDESREQMEDLEKEIRNNTYAIQDLNAEIVAYALEMKLLVSEIKMDEIELKLGDLEVFDSLYDMAEKVGLAADKMDLYTENLKSYSDAFLQIDGLYRRGSELLLPNSWEKSIQKGLDRIDQINNNQEKKTFNDNNRNEVITSTADYNTSIANAENTVSQADYIKQVQESRDGIIEMLKAIQELDKEMLEYYGETISKANEELGKFTSKMEHLTSVLNHYKSLTDMLGKPTDYENIGRMLKGQADLIRDQVEVAKATYEMYQGEVDDLKADLAQAEEGTYLYEMLSRQLEEAEQAMMESQENMLAKTEEWAGLMKQIFENDLAKAAQALENALTGGTSFDQLAQQWERANSLQENYLTATNQIYETTKLMRNAQKEIDKTSNEAAKNRLNAFVKETEQLRDQGKLSNYELEVQQAKYDLLLAEIALEEARNAKSMVRLQRDNEGNYGYVYTADQDKIADAEQKVDDANNKLYNISLEGQINYSQQYQGLMQEYYNALVELQTNYQNGAFESEAEYQNQKQQLLDYYNKKAAELLDIYNMATLTSMEATNDAWTTNLMDIIAKEDEWTIATQDYLTQVEDAFKNMEEAVSQVEKDLGIEFGNMESSITKITNASDALKQSLVDTTIPEIKKTFVDVQAATQKYGAFRTEIAGAVTAAENLVTQLGNIVKDAATVVTEVNKEAKAFEDLAIAIRDANKAKGEEPTNTTNTTDNNTDNTTPKNPDNNNNNKDVPPEVKEMANQAMELIMKVHRGDADLLAAGYIPNKNGWKDPAKKLGYSETVIELARKAFSESDKNRAYGYILDEALKIAGYDTGGYTGSWGTAGKLALLHEKELVLNKEDTKNLLASVQMVRDYIDSIDLNTISMLALNPYTAASLASQGAQLDQNVTIEANFPSVTDRNEIEEALKSLVNRASQYINK